MSRSTPPHWEEPIPPLRHDGDDPRGLRLQRPPELANVRDELPSDRVPVIGVLGSSGYRASWQAGIVDALEDVVQPIRWDLASGGTIPGLAAAAGINKRWRRQVNAGAPGHAALAPIPGLRWFERRNLDFAGIYELTAVETWLASWLAWAGVQTFADLRYQPGERRPPGVAHRAGICVSVWRSDRPYPRRCSPDELRDPLFARDAFRWALYTQFPFRRFRQAWVPDTIGEHLPWLAGEIDDHSPAWWARISMSQWPACVPAVSQDPETLQLVFLGDGGHIDNQPSLFNTGRPVPVPLLNPRLAQNRRQLGPQQRIRDLRRMPFGEVVRFPVTPETSISTLGGAHLTWEDRDAMWRRGLRQARELLPPVVERLRESTSRWESRALQENAAASSEETLVEVPGLHGFQAIAAVKRPHTKRVFGLRS